MSGALRGARGRTGVALAAWLGAATGCVEVPEPLELELAEDDDDVFVAVPEEVRMGPPPARSDRDHEAWPLVDDPWLAELGRREARTYPLWRTPIDEPCPAVMFGSVGPPLDGGPTFDRVKARLATVARPELFVSPSEIVLLHDHVGLPGLRLFAASDTSGGCTMGWTHTHCFVSATDVYCPDGSAGDLERLLQAYGLGPGSWLPPAAWLELAVVMSGAERIVVEPALVRECTSVADVEALAPTVGHDEEAGVTVRFTALADGHGVDHTVIVGYDGDVRMETTPRWREPFAEDPWDGVVDEAAER